MAARLSATEEINFKPKRPRRKQFNWSLPENLATRLKAAKEKATKDLGLDFNEVFDDGVEALLERMETKLNIVSVPQFNGHSLTDR